VKRILLAVLTCGTLVANSGCCGALLYRLVYCPLGPGTQCDPGHCGHGYMVAPGPAYGPVADPGYGVGSETCGPVACETCAPVACDPCAPVACEPAGVAACGPVVEPGCGPAFGPYYGPGYGYPYGVARCCGLLGGVFRILFPPCWCGRGCGPVYWSEFHSDPPDCCDPCDRCGNFTGGGCVSCVSCGPAACGPPACGPSTCDAPAPMLPAREYVSRLKAPVEPAPTVTRLARPPKAKQR